MAERRMFSKTIIDSDAFTEMPLSSQVLYFHLAMRADDDGFVNNPRKIQRMIGAADDDMRIIIAKRFILTFHSGVIVIKHWRMHNYLRSDRYRPTVYTDEIACLEIKENGAYTERVTPIQSGIPIGIPDVHQWLTQDSIGKDRIDKDPVKPQGDAEILDRFNEFWNEYPRKVSKKYAFKVFQRLGPDEALLESMIQAVRRQKRTLQWSRNNGEFIPHPSTWISQERWMDETEVTAPKDDEGEVLHD